MANEAGKLYAAQKKYVDIDKGAGKAATDDEHLDEKRHDRAYNPIDEAERATVSEKLNQDSGRYRKGPGPM